MVVVLLMHCLWSMGELNESNDAWVTSGREKHLAGVDCLPIGGRPLRGSLEGDGLSNKAVGEVGKHGWIMNDFRYGQLPNACSDLELEQKPVTLLLDLTYSRFGHRQPLFAKPGVMKALLWQ